MVQSAGAASPGQHSRCLEPVLQPAVAKTPTHDVVALAQVCEHSSFAADFVCSTASVSSGLCTLFGCVH